MLFSRNLKNALLFLHFFFFFFFCLIHLIVVFILFQHEFGDHRNMSMLVETPAGKKLFAFDKVMEIHYILS